MATTYEGNLIGKGKRFGVVISRFNEFITNKLLGGAMDAFTRHGVDTDAVDVAWVPGSFETPVTALRMARCGRYDAVVCLGCVIRGQTSHFEYVAGQVAKGVAQAALQTGIPCIFGVITADTLEQAIERAGAKAGNKGSDAARSAIEMANLLEQLPKAGS